MHFPYPNWNSAGPSSVGMDQARFDQFLQIMQTEVSHPDVTIIRNGKIIGSTGSPDRHADWASIMKIWLSTLVVMMVQDQSIGSYDENKIPWLDQQGSGHYMEAFNDDKQRIRKC